MKILKKIVRLVCLLVAAGTAFCFLFVVCFKHSALMSFVALEKTKGVNMIPYILLNFAAIWVICLALFFALREKKKVAE